MLVCKITRRIVPGRLQMMIKIVLDFQSLETWLLLTIILYLGVHNKRRSGRRKVKSNESREDEEAEVIDDGYW